MMKSYLFGLLFFVPILAFSQREFANYSTKGRTGTSLTEVSGSAFDREDYSFSCRSLFYEMNPYRWLGMNGLGIEFTGGQTKIPLDTIGDAVFNRIEKIRIYSLRLSESIWMSKMRHLSFQGILKPGYQTHWTMIDNNVNQYPAPTAVYNNSFILEGAVGARFQLYYLTLYFEVGKDLLNLQRSFVRLGLGINWYKR
jgi:hypothetical protein